MEYLIGVVLALAVAAYARLVGLDRAPGFYPPVLMVVASYYVLFAVMGASGRVTITEILAGSVFALLATLGFQRNPWLLAIGLVGHGLFDAVHHFLIANPGVPPWWPGFCGSFDVLFGLLLALQLRKRSSSGGRIEA